MKKSFLAILFAASLLSLAACKPGAKSDQTADTTKTAPATQMAAPADTTHAAAADTTMKK